MMQIHNAKEKLVVTKARVRELAEVRGFYAGADEVVPPRHGGFYAGADEVVPPRHGGFYAGIDEMVPPCQTRL